LQRRQRIRQSVSLQDRLRVFADDIRTRAAELSPGVLKDDMLRKARQADTACHLEEWVNSSGLQAPK